MNVRTLSGPERAVWDAFPRGETVDLTGRARTIRGEVIAALLLGARPAEAGRVAAVRVNGARITGTLDLGHGVTASPVHLRQCEVEGVIDLTGARTRDIDLAGSKLAGLTAPRSEVDGSLSLDGCECSGPVLLSGAHVTGSLSLPHARLACPGAVALLGNRLTVDDDLIALGASVDGELRLAGAHVGGSVLLAEASLRNAGGYALNASNLSVGARFLARDGFSAHGEVRLAGLQVESDLSFRAAALSNPGGIALLAYDIRARSVTLSGGFRAAGSVRLSRSRISAALSLGEAHLSNPAGDAIRCRNTQAQTLDLGAGLEASGIADFRNSQFANIRDGAEAWPPRLRLSGLRYDELIPPLATESRIRWLHRDEDGYLPRSYETLAAMYRNSGDDASARQVLLARERAHRAHLSWYGQAWSWLQEVTVGYGYRPLRAVAWLLAFLAAGTLVFGLHHPPPLAGAPHPAFSPFIYTLDLLVPVVDFGQGSAYDPQGPQRWLAYLLIAAGWIFVTTVAAGIARVLRRQ